VTTAANAEVAGDGPLIKIPTGGQPFQFAGELIVERSTERPQVQRWTDLRLYRTLDGTGRYVVVSIGRSVRYHDQNSICGQGVRTHTNRFPKDAEPCPRCQPERDWKGNPGYYDMETDNFTPRVCEDALEVIDALGEIADKKNAKSRRGTNHKILSSPAQQLLKEAAQVDEGIARAMRMPVTL
jgi:hypothetical protein